MRLLFFVPGLLQLTGCGDAQENNAQQEVSVLVDTLYERLAEEVKQETLRSWKAYKQYAGS